MHHKSEHEAEANDKLAHRKLAKEKLAFLPAALEIQAAPPAKWSRSLLWIIIALMVTLIVWASWAEIDIIATAQGKIVPSGKVKIIQPLETGVVKTIFVKEGQHIKAGDKLIALDNTSSQADADRLSSELQGYIDDLARQNAFLAKLDAVVSSAIVDKDVNTIGSSDPLSKSTLSKAIAPSIATSKIPLLPTNQRLLLESVWQEYQSKLNSFTSEITKLMAEKKSISIDVGRIEKTLPLVIERERSYFTLLETSAVSRNQYLELKQQRIDQEETLLLQRAKIEQINASIVSAEQNLYAYLSETRRNTLQEINQLTRQSESAKQELTKANRLTQLRVLISPVDGVVEELVIATIGGIVTPAQELLKIVPNEQQLEVEAGLLNKDIGFVHVGQIAEIKIDSFPFTKYGVIDGEVTDISADAVEHEQLGLLFQLKASLVSDEINVNGKLVKLKPGMSVTVEVKTGTRRLIEFLLAPLMKGVSEGARER
ncbi:MAG: HlyD family type I secretion periplasmic adaptor subunit [Gammaproteobacteria bacterium]|nr:HlyD family type I secretion periplasmic adaptor subunit [Gammaproteobacteria bacterium]MBU1479806.1 HlyD family type I secretion periplasmic adaptor subunit [Gammaproteobacteria bacterium]MBU1999496.1 HlyD family type I secretion periplasmic adaptor subunit [Gammaproteobacteria bacterium]MBU2130695.1 HlyD family type I secretion periplasmic adaptor subunit [Gammaproteobacteria bacterium]MBU2186933.1 HlyD family type I secretion periplasmic adaptor subunit [Gammaproteobacteria bacterium]